jgi:hypothetical protein
MLLHLARLSVITIALALVATLGFLFARPSAPTVITVVVPQPQAAATIVQPAVVPAYWPYYWGACGSRGPCWRD